MTRRTPRHISRSRRLAPLRCVRMTWASWQCPPRTALWMWLCLLVAGFDGQTVFAAGYEFIPTSIGTTADSARPGHDVQDLPASTVDMECHPRRPFGGEGAFLAVDRSLELSGRQWRRLLTLQDYNTRVVVLGTCLLGLASGLVGSFTLLRKRALMGDALSHATLPGIGFAFIFATILGADGKSLPILLLGAAVTGLFGVGAILFIRNATRLKEDVALAVVLSVFFGAGLAVLGVAQNMKAGHAAGLESFILGKTASMVVGDAALIGGSAFLCLLVCVLLFKEFKLLCFDEAFAGARGFSPFFLDVMLMALVVTITIVGLQAVGLVLMIALLVIPAAAARFWTERLRSLAILSSLIGGVGSLVGASLSAVLPKLPSGAMIVLTSSGFFLASMLFGTGRGVLVRFFRRTRLNHRIDRQHLLRAMYELLESSTDAGQIAGPSISRETLLSERSWGPRRLVRCIRRCQAEGLVFRPTSQTVELTEKGFAEAERLTRQHRLWELYLITHADIAPGRVDRDADAIEHVLEPEMVQKLSRLLHEEAGDRSMPRSPHAARPNRNAMLPNASHVTANSGSRESSRRAGE